MSELLALGVSHHTAPIEMRERLALTEGRATGILAELSDCDEVHEAVALSTCNRTELYMLASDSVGAESRALSVLARKADIRPTELVANLYTRHGADAARHLFRVTAGLDSMIVGEVEIQGQVKRAYELALVEGVTGPILNRLFRGALAAGKRARTETAISRGGVSVPSAAVELAHRSLGDLANRRVLLIGAGEMAELTARALSARGAEAVFVANRRHDRAIGLAQRYGGRAVRLDDLPQHLAAADMVVSVTNSPHHIIERDGLELVMAAREEPGSLLILDLAVPRDVDPDCRDIAGVTVYDVDGVQEVADRNASGRESEARRAERLIAAELARFEQWMGSLQVLPTVSELRGRADRIVAAVLAENEGRWQELSESDRQRIAAIARAIAGRILHEPTLRLKRSAEGDGEDAYLYVTALRELFGLDAGTEPEAEDAEVTPIRRQHRGA